MNQLSLFSQYELNVCDQVSKAIRNTRKGYDNFYLARLKKNKKPVPTMGQVIKFPIKKVS